MAADRLLPVQLPSEVGALNSAGCYTIFIFLDKNTLAAIDTGNFVPGTMASTYNTPLFDPSVGFFTQTIFHNFPGLVLYRNLFLLNRRSGVPNNTACTLAQSYIAGKFCCRNIF